MTFLAGFHSVLAMVMHMLSFICSFVHVCTHDNYFKISTMLIYMFNHTHYLTYSIIRVAFREGRGAFDPLETQVSPLENFQIEV